MLGLLLLPLAGVQLTDAPWQLWAYAQIQPGFITGMQQHGCHHEHMERNPFQCQLQPN